MSGRPGNPNMVRGVSGNPSGRDKGTIVSARSLALACRDAASDEEIVEWLLEIASGRWPEIRASRRAAQPNPDGVPVASDMMNPPSGEQRMSALKEFLLRREGQPMQAVVLKADIEARARRIENASDAIEITDADPVAAAALEVMLQRALLGVGSNSQPVIDVEATEVPTK